MGVLIICGNLWLDVFAADYHKKSDLLMPENTENIKAHIFDIQGLSMHDGPGCRTLVFFSGCTLNCFWCSNPEGIPAKPPLLYYHPNCILCGNCAKGCPHDAIVIDRDRIKISREKCFLCAHTVCAEHCLTNALRLGGYEITLPELFRIIMRDSNYWGSNGGVTLTGGEPLLQIDFVLEFLKKCYDSYIHTAIETCGNLPWSYFKRVIPFLDWIFFDLKHLDPHEHERGTTANNKFILDNARKLAAEYPGRLIFRLPYIPGFNDSESGILTTISFLKEIGKNEINILPLHHLGREKYKMLDRDYYIETHSLPTTDNLSTAQKIFNNAGITCYLGSQTPF